MGWIIAVIVLAIIIAVVKVMIDRGGKAENARLRGFGIVVDGDQVKAQGKVLGPVSTAHADVQATQRHTLTRVATVAGAATKKTDGTVVISVGTEVITKTFHGASEYRRAMTFAAKLNALASQAKLAA